MWEFLVAGGPFMVPLVITSIVGVAFIIERGLALRWASVIPVRVEQAARGQSREDVAELKQICRAEPSPLSTLLLTAFDHLPGPRDETVEAVQTRARHEVLKLERGLVVLEIVVGIAPLLGLVGAIYGLITLFSGLGQGGQADNAVLAQGIAEALNTTLTGLLIAIPCLIAWSYYNKKVESLAVEMESVCDDFVRRQYRGSRKVAA
jgi:biopolymer transport protein ExbB